jgi:hypothetical protein
MNPNEQLGYISSAPLLVGTEEVKPQDEAEITTLERAFQLLENRQAYYQSIASLSEADRAFDVSEQLRLNKQMLFLIQELEALLASTINKVREKQQNG